MKIKKPMLCCCFTWIVFIEINFTVAFLIMRKTCDYQFASKVGDGGFQEMGDDFEMGGWYPFTDYAHQTLRER